MDQNKSKTILIIEDEASIRKVLTDELKEQDFSVVEARDGKEGVDEALKIHPDLILLDVLMPIMDGMEALKKIRKDTWGKQVPVIILTNLSATEEDLVQSMVAERPAYYLIKSDWKIKDVIKKIKDVLKM